MPACFPASCLLCLRVVSCAFVLCDFLLFAWSVVSGVSFVSWHVFASNYVMCCLFASTCVSGSSLPFVQFWFEFACHVGRCPAVPDQRVHISSVARAVLVWKYALDYGVVFVCHFLFSSKQIRYMFQKTSTNHVKQIKTNSVAVVVLVMLLAPVAPVVKQTMNQQKKHTIKQSKHQNSKQSNKKSIKQLNKQSIRKLNDQTTLNQTSKQ